MTGLRGCSLLLLTSLGASVLACNDASSTPGGDSPYADEALWLCRPDIDDDKCAAFDLSVTEIHADGSRTTRDTPVNPDAQIDCFYVYPTVDDESGSPGNTEKLSKDDPLVVRALRRDAARFRGVCRLFAPLYHQMTLETYTAGGFWTWHTTEFFARAYADVAEAFDYYIETHNAGRGIVLLGHSQGAHMLAQLLEDRFDHDESLRDLLVSALLVGAGGRVFVPEGGALAGGTLSNIPLCDSDGDTGCVVAFDAVAARVEPVPFLYAYAPQVGMQRACVNPAVLVRGGNTLGSLGYARGTLLVPSVSGSNLPFPDTIETEWVSYPGLYTARCNGADVWYLLEVDIVTDDARSGAPTPQEIQELGRKFDWDGLHWAETIIAGADLVKLVEAQIESRGGR